MAPKNPSFQRQKFILMFVKLAGGSLPKIDFQNLIFLFQQKNRMIFYNFIPYFHGCFSFQANDDLATLQREGWISITDTDVVLTHKYPPKIDCYNDVRRFLSMYDEIHGNKLLKSVYLSYPYYAINSSIAQNLLTEDELLKIKNERQKCTFQSTTLFTIGYEGLTVESYLNKLIQNNVRVLCDVRSNPLSRKFGFSKITLSSIVQDLNIVYVHIPELGIVSDKRKNAEQQRDYKSLFKSYLKALPENQSHTDKIYELLNKHGRVALTCFEKDPNLCHRTILSQYIKDYYAVKVANL